jgi:hypothetical protein
MDKTAYKQEIDTEGRTIEVSAVFGAKLRLEDIVAQRVLQDLHRKTLDNQGESACNSAQVEV